MRFKNRSNSQKKSPACNLVRRQSGDRADDDGQAPESGDEGRDGAIFNSSGSSVGLSGSEGGGMLNLGERKEGEQTEAGQEEADDESDARG